MAETRQSSSSKVEIIPIIGVNKPEKMSREKWLASIMAPLQPQQQKSRIHRAPAKLREAKENAKFFEPAVVSLGPYHHGKCHLQDMEKQKPVAAQRFVSNSPLKIEIFYAKVGEVADEAKECYSNDPTFKDLDTEEFTRMMFLDGCFVLEFIESCQKAQNSLTMRRHLEPFVVRDMFMLENQLPFIVLKELMSLKCLQMKMIDQFIHNVINPPGSPLAMPTNFDVGNEEFHLLHRLRCHLLNHKSNVRSTPVPHWHSFRSVMELKQAGIQFKRSRTISWKDVGFESGRIYGELSLPPIVIDDSTKHRFLNLIAYEMCPNGPEDYEVASYVCLLDSFIDHPEDVKELRKNEILLNNLGSDEEVTELFNVVANDLAPDPDAYAKVMKDIGDHCKHMWKTHCATLFYTHFSSPWTTVSLIAAIFLIILTMAQTYFAIFPRDKKETCTQLCPSR